MGALGFRLMKLKARANELSVFCLAVFVLLLFCATNYYQILNGRIFLHFLAGGFVVGVGIGFASLAHPCLVVLCKKSATTYRCLHLIFVLCLLVSELPAAIKRKSGATFVVPDFLRRERDSCFGKRLRRLRTPARVFSSPLM